MIRALLIVIAVLVAGVAIEHYRAKAAGERADNAVAQLGEERHTVRILDEERQADDDVGRQRERDRYARQAQISAADRRLHEVSSDACFDAALPAAADRVLVDQLARHSPDAAGGAAGAAATAGMERQRSCRDLAGYVLRLDDAARSCEADRAAIKSWAQQVTASSAAHR